MPNNDDEAIVEACDQANQECSDSVCNLKKENRQSFCRINKQALLEKQCQVSDHVDDKIESNIKAKKYKSLYRKAYLTESLPLHLSKKIWNKKLVFDKPQLISSSKMPLKVVPVEKKNVGLSWEPPKRKNKIGKSGDVEIEIKSKKDQTLPHREPGSSKIKSRAFRIDKDAEEPAENVMKQRTSLRISQRNGRVTDGNPRSSKRLKFKRRKRFCKYNHRTENN